MISESKIFSMQTQQNNIYKLIFAQKHERAKFEGVTTASSIHLRSCRFICHIKDAQYFKYFDCITIASHPWVVWVYQISKSSLKVYILLLNSTLLMMNI